MTTTSAEWPPRATSSCPSEPRGLVTSPSPLTRATTSWIAAWNGWILHPQRVAVQIGQLVRRRPETVLIDQLVAAGRLADGAVVERLRPGRNERADRERDECEPAADRQPRPARAPAPDHGDGPHALTLCRGKTVGPTRNDQAPVHVRRRCRHGGSGRYGSRPNLCERSERDKGEGDWENHGFSQMIQRAGGGFIHRSRWLSDSGLRLPRTTLGCGFDLLPLRARCTREPTRSVSVRQDPFGAEVRKMRKLPVRLLP